MPEWVIKSALAVVFGVPLLIGVFALMFGDVWLGYMDKKEDERAEAECNCR